VLMSCADISSCFRNKVSVFVPFVCLVVTLYILNYNFGLIFVLELRYISIQQVCHWTESIVTLFEVLYIKASLVCSNVKQKPLNMLYSQLVP
jgi:hypothetical protein